MPRRLLVLCAALAVVRLSAQTTDVSVPADEPLERQLSRGDEHRYALALHAGEYVRVAVDQRATQLIVELRAPNGMPIAAFDDDIRPNGRELVEFVADRAGTYIVNIKLPPGAPLQGAYAIRLEERHAATEAERAMCEVRRLRTSAVRVENLGRFEPARILLAEALAIVERERGPGDLQTAAVLGQLAGVYRLLPDNVKSEAAYTRALAIVEAQRGPNDPNTAFLKSRLALLCYETAQRARAEALLSESLDVLERTIGTDNRWFVSALVTLGNMRSVAGDLEHAEAVIRRGVGILEKTGDTESVLYASLQNNLGEVYRRRGDFAAAGPFYQRALEVGARVLGDDDYSLAIALQNLGIVARERKDYETAVAYYARAQSIRERIVGPDHPDVAQILNNLAIVYRNTGDIRKSLDMHLQALGIWENAAGPYQQATLIAVGNIARTYAAMADMTMALAYQRRADLIIEKELALNLAIGSERQKLAFVASVAERTDRTISLHLNQAPHDPVASDLAALVVLQRKGRVLDAMADTLGPLRERVASADDRRLLDQLKTTTAELARLGLNAPDPARREEGAERLQAIKDLETAKERLEADLSAHSAELRAQLQPVTLDAVRTAIPDGAALVEFAVFRPFDPKAERNAEAYGPAHYAAYVLKNDAAPRGLDLGGAREIDQAIGDLRQVLRDPRATDLKARARIVDERVMRPLRAQLGGATRLLVSPDGELNLIPFEALVDEYGHYLIERFSIGYLTSGRDLLRMQVKRPAGGPPVIVADPFFGEGEDMPSMYFAPLAATGEEAREIKALFPDAALLTGRQATKAKLQQVEAPRILHIASHGFFLRDDRPGTVATEASNASTRAINPGFSTANPLLRSGLALAGANLSGDARDDGILTALEASSLNLWGTKLVTLSACDTGVGEIRNGEGVYGLRRAFVLAGTETLVMSLWPVSDAIAREMMVSYYTGLRAGLGRGDALRQAKLAMLKRSVRQHPFYWASFIQSGEWASLDGSR